MKLALTAITILTLMLAPCSGEATIEPTHRQLPSP